jgi:transcriptional regulator with XRE-family HTH domain
MSFVAANLRALRRARSLTQEGLAALAEIDVRHLSELENARRTPSFRLLVVLADALEVEASELFKVRAAGRIPRGRPRKTAGEAAESPSRPNPTPRSAESPKPGAASGRGTAGSRAPTKTRTKPRKAP